MENKKKEATAMFKKARQIAEMNDYIHSEHYNINDRITDSNFIKRVREYAIQKKGFSVFDEINETAEQE